MKQFLSLAALCLLLGLTFYQTIPQNSTQFESWSQKFGKFYTPIEKQYRQQVYQQNLLKIQQHNSDKTQTYTMGENQFMDITQEEFGFLVVNKNSKRQKSFQDSKSLEHSVPEVIDWRGIASVRDQGSCKAGGPMSVASAVDAFYSINNKQKIYSSAQQLIDCNGEESNCDDPQNFFFSLYQVSNNGLTSDTKYPYVGKQEKCKGDQGEYKINQLIYLENGERAFKFALTTGPINVAVEASKWQFYKSGVFSNCGTQANHYVLGVGYDISGNWLVQNSFGTGWGSNGYITLAPGNTCGFLEDGWQFI